MQHLLSAPRRYSNKQQYNRCHSGFFRTHLADRQRGKRLHQTLFPNECQAYSAQCGYSRSNQQEHTAQAEPCRMFADIFCMKIIRIALLSHRHKCRHAQHRHVPIAHREAHIGPHMPQEVSRFQQYRQPQKSRQIQPEPFCSAVRFPFRSAAPFAFPETSRSKQKPDQYRICNLEQPLKQIIQTMPFHHTEIGQIFPGTRGLQKQNRRREQNRRRNTNSDQRINSHTPHFSGTVFFSLTGIEPDRPGKK